MKYSQIWTIGHSTRNIDEFISILKSFQIEYVIDVRSFPGSRKFPHFNKENLEIILPQHNIQYIHIKKLGGRRTPNPNSKNTSWHNLSFRAYADYMENNSFLEGISELENIALNQNAVYMCSEAVWWRCHRSMISDYLKSIGWNVLHIMDINKTEEHPYTKPAKIIDDKLSYADEQLTFVF